MFVNILLSSVVGYCSYFIQVLKSKLYIVFNRNSPSKISWSFSFLLYISCIQRTHFIFSESVPVKILLIFKQVSEKLKLGAKTALDIDKLRDGYRPAARRGAILFFVLADLSSINTMYQYSLSSYLEVFQYSLKKSMPDTILQKRLKNIMDTLTHNVYDYGCTGELLPINTIIQELIIQ